MTLFELLQNLMDQRQAPCVATKPTEDCTTSIQASLKPTSKAILQVTRLRLPICSDYSATRPVRKEGTFFNSFVGSDLVVAIPVYTC